MCVALPGAALPSGLAAGGGAEPAIERRVEPAQRGERGVPGSWGGCVAVCQVRVLLLYRSQGHRIERVATNVAPGLTTSK